MKTIILRHRRENLKKCSLRGLESRSDLIFLEYPKDTLNNSLFRRSDQVLRKADVLETGANVLYVSEVEKRGISSKNGRDSRNGVFQCIPKDPLPDLRNYLLLDVDAPPLSIDDQNFGIFLIDATWRLSQVMRRQCPTMERRSLPAHYRTAYPRRQTDCPDPLKGLASIEALYLSHLILQRPADGLLDGYHWKDQFLQLNHLRCS